MKRGIVMVRVYLWLVILLASCADVDGVDLDEASRIYEEGKTLVEDNHHESMGATQEGLERGIENLVQALELGYSDALSILFLLAESYNDLAFSYHDDTSTSFKNLLEKRDECFRRLLVLYPDNAEVIYRNLDFEDEYEQRESLLRKALAADPDHVDSLFDLGTTLIQRGDIEEGLPLARRAVELSDALEVSYRGHELIGLLREQGQKQEARKLLESLEKLEARKLGRPYPTILWISGKRLIEDAVGLQAASVLDDIELGIEKIEGALKLGHEAEMSSFDYLLRGVRVILSYHVEEGSARDARFRNKVEELLVRMLGSSSPNLELILDNVDLLPKESSRTEVLRQVLTLDPKNEKALLLLKVGIEQ